MRTDGVGVSLLWFRRDLRLEDSAALARAAECGLPIVGMYAFHTGDLPADARQHTVVYRQLSILDDAIRAKTGGGLLIFRADDGVFSDALRRRFSHENIKAVFANDVDDPRERERERIMQSICEAHGIPFFRTHDATIYPHDTIVKPDGSPYGVYTPYARRWRERFHIELADPVIPEKKPVWDTTPRQFPTLKSLGIHERETPETVVKIDDTLLREYAQTRDLLDHPHPTSRIGTALAIGAVSIRHAVRRAIEADSQTFLSELVWREFFHMLICHAPETIQTAYQPHLRGIEWGHDERSTEMWKAGKTGFPLVDAGMRELSETGYMPNRLRMLSANFLCKLLRTDWRLGERHFAGQLSDYDPASNTGNWQWSAGIGADSVPYFRIFSPTRQIQRFDPEGAYRSQWLDDEGEIEPIIDYERARREFLTWWKYSVL